MRASHPEVLWREPDVVLLHAGLHRRGLFFRKDESDWSRVGGGCSVKQKCEVEQWLPRCSGVMWVSIDFLDHLTGVVKQTSALGVFSSLGCLHIAGCKTVCSHFPSPSSTGYFPTLQ